MLLYKKFYVFNIYLTQVSTRSINFAVRGLKRKQALLGSNLSAIDPSRYAVTDMGLRFLSPFSVWISISLCRTLRLSPYG